ncbi:MAG: tyrosine--tRNA ligase [Candidatus Hydrogenedentota bacterium]|nr:MAG: tyrosine--tRNA ligase [Candidatus Hydrogenedentota bacterium]
MSSEKEKEIHLPAELEKAYQEIARGAEEILPEKELKQKLLKSYKGKKPLRVKAGFDPTAPDLHLGHTVLLQKMRTFQKLGHTVLFLIGDYTALIGDPTGKSETRPRLTPEEVEQNAKTYKEQVFKILDPEKTEVVFNSKWLAPLRLEDVLSLTAKYTVARMLERDDFQKRYKSGTPISIVEFLYPLMQGYDSVALQADIELGGTDQKFNLLVGRDLQGQYGQDPQVILTMPLLVGLDGVKKMSKSLGNYVGIQEPPIEIFGKLMSISDDLMWEYYRLLSDLNLDEIQNLKEKVESGQVHPKQAKENFAMEIIARFYSQDEAQKAKQEWEKIHRPDKRGIPDHIEEYKVPDDAKNPDGTVGLLNALRLSGLCPSNSEARRIVLGNGVHLLEGDNEMQLKDPKMTLAAGEYIVRVGKRKFRKIIV